MSEIKGGQLKHPSGILYSPLLLLSLYAWPKLVQPIPEGGKGLYWGGKSPPAPPPPEINPDAKAVQIAVTNAATLFTNSQPRKYL